jgi:4-amino-4-deoxy-L-arabinose transferase-like glycosyltransferase
MRERLRDYALLLLGVGVVSLPSLGRYSLWDVDEGVNAQAAREMAEADTWIVPTFNYTLRTAKPVLLYWLQRGSYALLGVSEWSARLPSVLCALGAVLLVYELGRRMWDRLSGLWAGVILASAVQFVILARAATPDAPLLFFTVLTFLAFWWGQEQNRRLWWHLAAVACGLAVLTKGPVGVVLPALVILLYWTWQRQWQRLWDHRLLSAAGVFLVVAGPWYALVASETRGEWVKAFIARENLERFARPMEGHRGPFFYYVLVLPIFFAPWSLWIIPTLEHSWQRAFRRGRRCLAIAERKCSPHLLATTPVAVSESQSVDKAKELSASDASPPLAPTGEEDPGPYRFLLCWIAAYLVVFSAAATKLPNYIFPLYPALALLTARWFVRWQKQQVHLAGWVVPTAVGLLTALGLAVGLGLFLVQSWYSGLGRWCWVGLIPVLGAVLSYRAWRRGDVFQFGRRWAVTGIVFVALVAATVPLTLDRHRAPKALVAASGVADPQRELRLAVHRWFAPSLVFYSGREVANLPDLAAVRRFLEIPTPAYLFLPAPLYETWKQTGALPPHSCLARHFDLLARTDIVVLTNAAALTLTAQHHDSPPPCSASD